MRIGYGISVAGSNQRSFASAQAEQVIWKVAIFGAQAQASGSNGEYVWDGYTLEEGKPRYNKTVTIEGNKIAWNPDSNKWQVYDYDDDRAVAYDSDDLIIWITGGDGVDPAPSSALSYSQNSFISSITLAGAGTTSSNGTYARSSDGTETPFISGSNQIFYDAGRWVVEDNFFADFVYESDGTIFNWTVFNGDSPAPTVSAIVYSA